MNPKPSKVATPKVTRPLIYASSRRCCMHFLPAAAACRCCSFPKPSICRLGYPLPLPQVDPPLRQVCVCKQPLLRAISSRPHRCRGLPLLLLTQQSICRLVYLLSLTQVDPPLRHVTVCKQPLLHAVSSRSQRCRRLPLLLLLLPIHLPVDWVTLLHSHLSQTKHQHFKPQVPMLSPKLQVHCQLSPRQQQ